ncbi:MAG: cupin domain-containing protein [Burkholderiales bacterium]|nr:MAG: cupin domain-containing protein [Burkholderiales bacterium]
MIGKAFRRREPRCKTKVPIRLQDLFDRAMAGHWTRRGNQRRDAHRGTACTGTSQGKETAMNTSITNRIVMAALVAGALSVPFAHAQQTPATPDDLKWVSAPASLPEGAVLKMLKGDLEQPGAFAFRMKLPAGYQIKPQSSSAIGRIVVVSGALNLGVGDTFDVERTIPLYAGYVHRPDKSPYFAFTEEETVIELEGVGPWAVTYVDPRDNPMLTSH